MTYLVNRSNSMSSLFGTAFCHVCVSTGVIVGTVSCLFGTILCHVCVIHGSNRTFFVVFVQYNTVSCLCDTE